MRKQLKIRSDFLNWHPQSLKKCWSGDSVQLREFETVFQVFLYFFSSLYEFANCEMKSHGKTVIAICSKMFQTFFCKWKCNRRSLLMKDFFFLISQSWLKSFTLNVYLFMEKFCTAWVFLRICATVTKYFYYNSAGCCTNKIKNQFLLCCLRSRMGLLLE